MSKLEDAVSEVLMKRLKRVVNSKNSRMSVSIHGCGYVGHWECLEVEGRATISNHEDHYSFDFKLRNNNARAFLDACDLEIPERKKP